MKIRTIEKVLIILALAIILSMSLVTISNATTINPNDYKPGGVPTGELKDFTDKASIIVSIIRVIGIIVLVITLLILGIKYMTGSIQEKAEYKRTMIPYLIGVVIFFALSQILGVIYDLMDKTNKQMVIDSTVSTPTTVTDSAIDMVQDMIKDTD